MSVEIRHPLYGRTKLNVFVENESKCVECSHAKVCASRVEDFCENYTFGTSAASGCQSCVLRYTRWDKDPIKCFQCKYFSPNGPPAHASNDRPHYMLKWDPNLPCEKCGGTGRRPVYSAGEEMVADFAACPSCGGTGHTGKDL